MVVLAEIRGAGWEQTGALDGVERRPTALNGIHYTHHDLQVRVPAGQSRRGVLLHTTALNGSEQQSTALYVAW